MAEKALSFSITCNFNIIREEILLIESWIH